jgi:hypothetical protein
MIGLGTGCGYKFQLDKKLTCDVDYVDWYGGLTRHLSSSSGNGEFDYYPTSLLELRTVGAYELGSGDLAWVTDYVSDYVVVSDSVVGSGYAWEDGDLDVRLDVERTWLGGAVESTRIYERRFGCENAVRVVTPDDDESLLELEVGTIEEDVYSYTREFYEDDKDLVVAGEMRSDGSWTEKLIPYQNGTLSLDWTDEGTADGSVTRTFLEVWAGSGLQKEGSWERSPSGVSHWKWTATELGNEWIFDYEVDFFGEGEGTVEVNDETCSVTVSAGECSYTCDGDATPC